MPLVLVNSGERLGELLALRGLSVPQFARRMSVSRQTVYNWLAGGYPSMLLWRRQCEVLGVSEAEFWSPRCRCKACSGQRRQRRQRNRATAS